MDFLLSKNPEALAILPFEKRAQIPGGLPEKLSLVEIAKLGSTDEEKQIRYLQVLVELCENGELEYEGDLEKWDLRHDLLDRPDLFVELAEQDKYKVAYPSDCLIHRVEFKRYLKSVHRWPIKDCLLSNWWTGGDGNAPDTSESELPKKWQEEARNIGKAWMLSEEKRTGERPGTIKISEYLEGELANRGITGPRGKLSAPYIKRTALKGITGRKANGK